MAWSWNCQCHIQHPANMPRCRMWIHSRTFTVYASLNVNQNQIHAIASPSRLHSSECLCTSQTDGNLKVAGGTVKDKIGGLFGNDSMQVEGAHMFPLSCNSNQVKADIYVSSGVTFRSTIMHRVWSKLRHNVSEQNKVLLQVRVYLQISLSPILSRA